MVHASFRGVANGRVNPVAPGAVACVGLALYAVGYRYSGGGVVIGAVLALLNGLLLSRRVELVADMGDVGRALLVMQLGLLVTCTIVGVATIILIHFSITLAVSAAIGFAVGQILMLASFYILRGRSLSKMERNPS